MFAMKTRSRVLVIVAGFSAGTYAVLVTVAGCSSSDTSGAGGGGATAGASGTSGAGVAGDGGVTAGAAGNSPGDGSVGGSSGADAGAGDAAGGTAGGAVPEAGPPPACDGGPSGCTIGACPPPVPGMVCCLHKYDDDSIQGTLTAINGCQGGINATVECQNNLGGTRGCAEGQICCGSLPDVPGGPTGSRCIPAPLSAPSGFCGTNPFICGPGADGGAVDTEQCRPGAGTAPSYACVAAPGTPISALGVCTEADAGDGG